MISVKICKTDLLFTYIFLISAKYPTNQSGLEQIYKTASLLDQPIWTIPQC